MFGCLLVSSSIETLRIIILCLCLLTFFLLAAGDAWGR